jgi:uncharacterized membrane protein (UPF0182 family)
VLKAWMSVFPGIVKSKSAMPAAIMNHIRYPEDLFEVQRSLLEQYHVDDPVQFYNGSNRWTVPTDPDPNATGDQPPYYVLADALDKSSTDAEFQLTTPMKVNNRANLAAYISVDSDPGPDYGRMTILQNFGDAIIPGPEQIANAFQSTDVISSYLTLQNQNQSRVTHGNLLTLPVGNTFLYVEPLYVQSSSSTSYPFLRRVLVAYGDTNHIGFGATVEGALSDFGEGQQTGHTVPNGTTGSPLPTTTPTTPSTSTPTSPTTSTSSSGGGQVTLAQLAAAQQELKQAYASGDYTQIANAQAKLNSLVSTYLSAHPDATSSPPSSPAGSPSASP